MFHGKGYYFFDTGERFEGDFLEGKKSGTGIYKFLNGNIYEGEYFNDKRVK